MTSYRPYDLAQTIIELLRLDKKLEIKFKYNLVNIIDWNYLTWVNRVAYIENIDI